MKSNRHKFVPTVNDSLEARVVLSTVSATKLVNGVYHLHEASLKKAIRDINNGYINFAKNGGKDFAKLTSNVGRGINRIPYHKADGLSSTVKSYLSQLELDVKNKIPGSVKLARNNTLASLKDFLADEVAAGRVKIVK